MTWLASARPERGTALGGLLVMLTLVAVLMAGVFRLAAVRAGTARRAAYHLQAQYAAESGVERLRWRLAQSGGWNRLWSPTGEPSPALTESLAVDTGYRLSLRPCGGYLEATVTGHCHKETVTVRALLGMRPPAWFQRAVTVRSSVSPLVLAGASRIRGDVLAGPGGVRTGRMPGEPLPPETPPVDGMIVNDGDGADFDPSLVVVTMTQLDRQLAGEGITRSVTDLGAFGEPLRPAALPDSVHGGVISLPGVLTLLTAGPDDPPVSGPLTLIASGAVRLQGHLILRGAIVVAAQDSIIVADRVDIRGGLLYTPGPIRLTDQARLEGQALSRSQIEVKDQAQVVYPGLLYATGGLNGDRVDGGILITSSRLQSGSLVVQPSGWVAGQTVRDRTTIRIGPASRFAGLVWSANATWLEGTLLGSAATGTFYLEHGPTTYLNWIRSGVIDRRSLTDAYRLPLGFGRHPQVEVVSWEWLDR
ncbi:MAG: hypothetical protein HY710_00545 [Candidatus Latescibacteria bacterium]|nr:hypothetical protein [Candidatus Latescibacterota bacterium]